MDDLSTLEQMPSATLDQVFDRPIPSLLSRFLENWLTSRHDHLMPSIAEIDPVTMPWALPDIFVVKRNPQGRFAYCLVGEKLASRLGGSLKGKTADLVFEPSLARQVESRWEEAAQNRMAYYITSVFHGADRAPAVASRITLPLSTDGETVDRLIGVVEYDANRLSDRHDPVADYVSMVSIADLPGRTR